MMFMMPMPPTSSAIPTTAPMIPVVVLSTVEIVFISSSCEMIWKSSGCPFFR